MAGESQPSVDPGSATINSQPTSMAGIGSPMAASTRYCVHRACAGHLHDSNRQVTSHPHCPTMPTVPPSKAPATKDAPTSRRRRLASTSSGPTSSGPTSSGPTSSGPTSRGRRPTSSGPTRSGLIRRGRLAGSGLSRLLRLGSHRVWRCALRFGAALGVMTAGHRLFGVTFV